MEKLRDDGSIPARAAEFLILTQVRVNEACGAKWDEIHLDPEECPEAPVWKIPGPRMKGRRALKPRPHWVPLSPQAIELLNSLPREKGNPHVFIASRPSKSGRANNAAVGKELKQRFGYDGVKLPKFTMHQMRATFGEWGFLKQNDYPKDVLEFCWAHVVGNMTSQAYLRETKFEQRRDVLNKWGAEITDGLKPLKTPEMMAAESLELRRAAHRDWAAKYPEKVAANNKNYRREHREELNADQVARYHADPEPVKQYQKKYRREHPDITRIYQQGYQAGIRAELGITHKPRGALTIRRTKETEQAYQKGYRAGKARAKKGGPIKGYRSAHTDEQNVSH
jgi:hypothetical protein